LGLWWDVSLLIPLYAVLNYHKIHGKNGNYGYYGYFHKMGIGFVMFIFRNLVKFIHGFCSPSPIFLLSFLSFFSQPYTGGLIKKITIITIIAIPKFTSDAPITASPSQCFEQLQPQQIWCFTLVLYAKSLQW